MLEKPDREEYVTRQELREELRWMMEVQRPRPPYDLGPDQRPGARYRLGPDFWAIVTVGVVLAGLLLSQIGSVRSELNTLRSDVSTQIGSLRSELNDQLRTIREDIKDLFRTSTESTAE